MHERTVRSRPQPPTFTAPQQTHPVSRGSCCELEQVQPQHNMLESHLASCLGELRPAQLRRCGALAARHGSHFQRSADLCKLTSTHQQANATAWHFGMLQPRERQYTASWSTVAGLVMALGRQGGVRGQRLDVVELRTWHGVLLRSS